MLCTEPSQVSLSGSKGLPPFISTVPGFSPTFTSSIPLLDSCLLVAVMVWFVVVTWIGVEGCRRSLNMSCVTGILVCPVLLLLSCAAFPVATFPLLLLSCDVFPVLLLLSSATFPLLLLSCDVFPVLLLLSRAT